MLELRSDGTHLPAQRTVNVPWNEWIYVTDVVMTPRSILVASAESTTGGFHFGATASDPDGRGTRWTGIYVPAGTQVDTNGPAPGGLSSSIGFRIGEYTTGDAGGSLYPIDATMPGELPAATNYTFAAEVEVLSGGAALHDYEFQNDVYIYVRSDEIADFADTTAVPAGTYDATSGRWLPGRDGVVIEVDRSSGTPIVPTPASLGMSNAERDAILADTTHFANGQRFWRVPVRHFSPIDLNYFAGLLGASPPSPAVHGPERPLMCSTTQLHSIIHCERQALGEAVALTGTPYSLSYVSSHQEGRREAFNVRFTPLPTAPSVTPDQVRAELLVAGQRIAATYSGTEMSEEQSLEWDGLDGYGVASRRLVGPQVGYLRIGYDYDLGYVRPSSAGGAGTMFGRFYGAGTSGERSGDGTRVTYWVTRRVTLGVIDDRVSGLGGWRLSEHHAYDPATGTLFYANGQQRSGSSVAAVTRTVDTTGTGGTTAITAVATGPDGAVYIFRDSVSGAYGQVYRLARGGGSAVAVGPSNEILVADGMAVSRDGYLYVADSETDVVFRIELSTGYWDRLVGGCTSSCSSTPSADAPLVNPAAVVLVNPKDVTVGLDGTVYIAEGSSGNRVLRYTAGRRDRPVSTTGTRLSGSQAESVLERIAGGGCWTSDPTRAACVDAAVSTLVEAGPDGAVYFYRSSSGGGGARPAIIRITPDGRWETVFGGGASGGDLEDGAVAACESSTSTACADGQGLDGMSISPRGEVCFAQAPMPSGGPTYDRRVRCIRDGRVYSVAGLPWDGASASLLSCPDSDGSCVGPNESSYPATRTRIATGIARSPFAWSPDGRLYYVDIPTTGVYALRVVEPTLGGSLVDGHLIASADGSMLYEFSPGGRHLRTLDAISHAVLVEFEYQVDGRLSGFTDSDGELTTITYGSTTITLTRGSLVTTLSLDAADGYVTNIENPASDDWQFDYASLPGLLTQMIDPRSQPHDFTYDSGTGYLLTDATAPDSPGGSRSTISLDRSSETDHTLVTLETSQGRETRYRFHYVGSPTTRRDIESDTGGWVSNTTTDDGRESVATYWDGTEVTSKTRPDILLGQEAAYRSSLSVVRPSGLETVVSRSRTYTGGSLPRTDVVTIGGRSYTTQLLPCGGSGEPRVVSPAPGGRS